MIKRSAFEILIFCELIQILYFLPFFINLMHPCLTKRLIYCYIFIFYYIDSSRMTEEMPQKVHLWKLQFCFRCVVKKRPSWHNFIIFTIFFVVYAGSTVWHPGCKHSPRGEERRRVRSFPCHSVFTCVSCVVAVCLFFSANTFLKVNT